MSRCCPSHGMKRVALILCCVLLIFNAVVVATVIYMVTKTTKYPAVTGQVAMLKQSLDKAYQEQYKEPDLALERSTQEGEKVPSLEFLSLFKPVIHLSGLDFSPEVRVGDNRISSVRNWAVAEGSERNLIYNGMTYEKGSITIPSSGSYLLYNHVKFYVENNNKGQRSENFYHAIYKYDISTNTEFELLSNNVTECKEGIHDGAHLEYPSDIRGVIHLNAGDEITVKVSHVSLLKHDRDWHYIGAYLV